MDNRRGGVGESEICDVGKKVVKGHKLPSLIWCAAQMRAAPKNIFLYWPSGFVNRLRQNFEGLSA
jgi:hypothetical protein